MKHIPFIFITAFNRGTKEAARGLEMGANDYITRPFSPEELLARVGANVRILQAEEAMRYQATILARRNWELALLNQIQRAVTASLNLDNVLDATMEQIQKLLQAKATSLWFVDQENQGLLLSAAFNEGPQAIHGLRLPLREGILGHVARNGQTFLSGDISTDLHYQNSNLDEDSSIIRSMICVPLHVRGKVIGVLQAVHHQLDYFNQDDLNLLSAVGDAVTVAIENAWLFGQVQLFNQQLEQKVEARTRELAREKEKTETIFVSIADGLLVINPDNEIMMANRAAEELLDFNLAAVVGSSIDQEKFDTPLWQFVRHVSRQPHPTYTATTEITKAHGKITSHIFGGFRGKKKEFMLSHDSDAYDQGHMLSIQAHAAKMWNETQRVYTGTVIVLRDVTALQEVDRMKARFMAGITHELKTPLAVIALHLGILLKHQSLNIDKRMERLLTIQRQADHLERLVEDILQLSRLDSGMLQLKWTPIELVRLSRQIVTELQPLAQEKALQLNFSCDRETITIEADKDQLGRVIRNLVDNAIKYTLQGHVTVLLEQQEQVVVLSVIDSGIGLSNEQIEKLFDRFYRADPSHNIPGTGLGLSIAREIVKLHNGDIQVKSTLGEGSTFTVYLPLTNISNSF